VGGASVCRRMAEDTDISSRGLPLKNTPTLTLPSTTLGASSPSGGGGELRNDHHKVEENQKYKIVCNKFPLFPTNRVKGGGVWTGVWWWGRG